jgi:hypothetical protein
MPTKSDKSRLDPNDLVVFFFHEAISRVIPGLVVLALYFPTYVSNAVKVARHSSLLCVLSIFIAAWVIGAAIESFFFFIIYLSERSKHGARVDDTSTKEERDLIYYHKYIAEKIMFRAFWLISFLASCIEPNMVLFTTHKWNLWYGIIAYVFTFLAYFWLFRYQFKSSDPRVSIRRNFIIWTIVLSSLFFICSIWLWCRWIQVYLEHHLNWLIF